MRYLRQTLRTALPAIGENLLNSTIILVDALMVASVGSTSLAAAGITGVILWRLRCLSSVLQVGFGASMARRWGEGNFSAARRLASHSLLLGMIVGTLCMIGIPFAAALFRALGADEEVAPLAAAYFQIILLAFPFRIGSVHLAACLRAAGDTRTPMLTTLVANIVNVFFNWIFIFGNLGAPALGLVGAGIGTVLAFLTEFIIYTSVLYKGISQKRIFASHRRDDAAQSAPTILRFSRSAFRPWLPGVTPKVLRIAAPSFLEEIAVSIGFVGFIAMIASLGKDALAAHTAVGRIESFSFNAGYGVSVAAAALVGQSLGARAFGDAKRFLSVSLATSITIMGLIGIVFCVMPMWFLQWFGSDAEGSGSFVAIGTTILILAAIEQPLIGSSLVLAGALRGAGYTVPPFISQMAGTVVIRIGLGYYLGFVLGMGLEGIYIATIADWLMRTLFLGWIVTRGRWLRATA